MSSARADGLALLMACAHPDPHSLLGAFAHPEGALVRVLKPGAAEVAVRTADESFALAPLGRGLFCGLLPVDPATDYRLLVTYPPGRTFVVPDGYRLPPTIDDEDLVRFTDGTHRRLWEVLGARPTMMGTPSGAVSGTAFGVWAPQAQGVAVIGDFDGWTGLGAPMRRVGAGVWEVFVPGVGPGDLYKYRIHQPDGRIIDRADPMARWAEEPPKTASRVAADRHHWRDTGWLRRRAGTDPRHRPMSTYEVHLGSWRPGLDYGALATGLVPYVAGLGFTHVELLPVTEHPYGASWGYQVTSYYAPTARHGDPDGLRALIDAFHEAGIGVIVDWVPAHFPRDGWALARFDGAPLYEPADPLRADHPDWGTLAFDFGRPQVRAFLLSAALYWIERFHVDGLRVDAVASMLYLDYSRGPGRWVPNEDGGREDLAAISFLQELTDTVARLHPGVALIAEDSSVRPGTTRPTASGGLGFTFQWNLGWMHDTLDYLARGADARAASPEAIARPLHYAFDEAYVLPISHDEVVHGKGTPWARIPGDAHARAADMRAMLAAMWAHPGKKLLFMGQEFAQETEWSDLFGPDWAQLRDEPHARVRDLVAHLNALYRSMPALWQDDCDPDGFTQLAAGIGGGRAAGGILAFMRTCAGGAVVCVTNLTDHHLEGTRLRTPPSGPWRIVVDTAAYAAGRRSHLDHNAAQCITVSVPAHSSVWLVPDLLEQDGISSQDGIVGHDGNTGGAP